ncbi:MAG: hypothetical protein A2087_14130 [Spirochaetes bacterium GWD1_61_31]|nr:MAG: hypothetical protein A2Y37_02080 [Spirochaetes bacterium GWB1_60_80]OHD33117.1 MAG: hypothetical protein A2004_12365 [Spirochaetes bacterium GWC1_61_12]OHD39583.1 MAG: hypothetical protein A2087_14130 [Spirochaetes bacterium GWD1_61_31]OHD43841.1 MAG: hypothetical protein A2Y35_00330 [Spirochaetes bacterium GWE1_60_18]OHD61171.1 MAG: hypothetical protein A2Y32_03640 [Spirochaetes bacterium GWF1_60_12]HAP44272.1 hypothetical protein [Spirochaetaceae bacterium]
MKKIFSFFNLPVASRFLLAGACYAACVALQLVSGSVVLGYLFVLPAWFVLAMKTIKNKPDDQGLENWRAVGEAEVNRIADTLVQTRRLQTRAAGPGCLLLLGTGVLVGIAFIIQGDAPHVSLALFDLAVFCIPALLFGAISLFVPADLAMKVPAFLPLMNATRPKDMILTPYIRFDEDKQKNEIPEDLRFMLEPRRKPDDLIGVQLQIAINKGPNGPVPYMYAVVLLRGRTSPLYRAFSGISVKGYEIEPGGDDEYGTVVIRQFTTGTGYHTKPADCLQLLELVIQALQKVLPTVAG